MPTSITKLAPQAILLAVAVYWSWPSLKEAVLQAVLAVAHSSKKAAGTRNSRPRSFRPRFRPPQAKPV